MVFFDTGSYEKDERLINFISTITTQLGLVVLQKGMEDDIRKAHAKNEQLIAAISSILICIDEQNRIVQWNNSAETTFSISAKKVIGLHFSECGIQWACKEIVNKILDCQKASAPTRFDDIRFLYADGKSGILGITVNPIIGNNGRPSGLLLVASDITERKIFENQLVQAQKLESIGQLAAGVAHEINTPIQYVGDNTRFLKESFSDIQLLIKQYKKLVTACKDGKVIDTLIQEIDATEKTIDLEYLATDVPNAIQQSLEGTERVTNIVHAMKEYSHPGSKEKIPIDINSAIESTITVARNEWKYVAQIIKDFDASLPLVPCLPSEFNQVILNMIINAAHAIDDMKTENSKEIHTITISTKRIGDWVEIKIQDTGIGIPINVRPKIFDPFFTTKEVGRGTGQGLAIAHFVIVEKHGGTISFETETGKGTIFSIRLPSA